MAVPNSQVFLSHNILVTPEDPQDRGDERRRPASSPPLKITIPTSFEDKRDDEGLKTPTSSIHRISEMLHCPPAPRKPKSLPSKKRRASSPRPLLLLDLSAEADSWSPTPFVVDVGGQIKKFKKS